MGYRIKSRFIYKQVGQRLKQLRNQKGVSQKVVADYLGVDRSTYTNYELGTSTMTYVTILMLARYFSVVCVVTYTDLCRFMVHNRNYNIFY